MVVTPHCGAHFLSVDLSGMIPATSIVATVPWTDRSFQLTSPPAKHPPLAVAGGSPRFPLRKSHWLFLRALQTLLGISTAISVGIAGIADASARYLPRLTHSPCFRLLANAPLGHHADRSPLAVLRGSPDMIDSPKGEYDIFCYAKSDYSVLNQLLKMIEKSLLQERSRVKYFS